MRTQILLPLAVALSAGASCKKSETPPAQPAPAPAAASPAPAAESAPKPPQPPPPAPAASAPSVPKWVKALPVRVPSVKPGDVVWATVPKPGEDEYAQWFGALKVEAVTGNTVALTGPYKARYADVPAAVLHPVAPAPGLKPGDIATASAHGSPRVGIVAKAAPGGGFELRYAWAGRPTRGTFEQVFPPIAGVAPLAWVHFKGEGFVTSRYKGLVVAAEGEKIWILSTTGRVEVVDRANAQPLRLTRDYRAGQRVFAYIPAYTEVTVQKVLEPGVRYRILWKVAGKEVPKDFFFDDLLEAL